MRFRLILTCQRCRTFPSEGLVWLVQNDGTRLGFAMCGGCREEMKTK